MAVKTDMSKAYDRLEWGFIRVVLQSLGFHEIWIGWIMACVESVSYFFLINGTAMGSVLPTRGIRQGDPLSPFLFILCTEVLSGLCREAQENDRLKGISVSVGGPRINHLLFADDTMFFCRSDKAGVMELKRILSVYERLSGQQINVHKSSIIFASKTPPGQREMAKNLLGIDRMGGVGKYLGLPEHFERRKRDLFASILDRIRQRAASWSNRFLSTAGKRTMLQSVLTSMPTYAMSCFKLPLGLCRKIQSILTRFWWDTKPEKKQISWLAWEKLTLSVDKGGLGFRDVATFNDALLAKLSWKLLNVPDCLLARVLLAKYCSSQTFLTVKETASMSHGWRGILIGRDLLKEGLGMVIGDGSSTKIWGDPWLSISGPMCAMGPPSLEQSEALVQTLILPNTNKWNVQAIDATLPHHLKDIMAIVPSMSCMQDRLSWLPNATGLYSVKSGYTRMLERKCSPPDSGHLRDFPWRPEIWRLQTLPKVRLFLWKALHNVVPSKEALNLHHVPVPFDCPRCGELETTSHIFFHCDFAKSVWNLVPICPKFLNIPNGSIGDFFQALRRCRTLPPCGLREPLYPWIVWGLWKARNSLVFNTYSCPPEEVYLRAIRHAKEWAEACVDVGDIGPRCFPRLEMASTSASVLCRSDAALDITRRVVGLGWVFMNTEAVILHYASDFRLGIKTPLLGEALAMLHAMREAITLGFVEVEFASDSMVLISLLQGNEGCSELNGVINDIRELKLFFSFVAFRYISRRENSFADGLAKTGLDFVT